MHYHLCIEGYLKFPLNIIFTKNVKLDLNVNHKVGKWIKLETRNLKIEILYYVIQLSKRGAAG